MRKFENNMLTLEVLKNQEEIYIYGAGKLGKKLCILFDFLEIKIKGIIVTDMAGQAKMCHGMEVRPFFESQISRNACVIVAVPQNVREGIVQTLTGAGYTNCFVWDEKTSIKIWQQYPHRFIDRRQGKDKVLFILCGYKKYLWDNVFARVIRFVPDDVEVCICSSGLYDEELATIAEQNRWSYLSTYLNSVSLIQNVAYSVFENCKWIYKMDEDMFLTKGCLEGLFNAYRKAEESDPYHVGIMAPLIPLNEHCCRLLLDKYNCVDDFTQRFGRLYSGGDGYIIYSEGIAKYMWGEGGHLPALDQMAQEQKDATITTCASRYNIGFVLFHRKFWEEMNGLTVTGGTDMGMDEEEICAWSINTSQPIHVTHDTIVGHFSFGPQTKSMIEYMNDNPECFKCRI